MNSNNDNSNLNGNGNGNGHDDTDDTDTSESTNTNVMKENTKSNDIHNILQHDDDDDDYDDDYQDDDDDGCCRLPLNQEEQRSTSHTPLQSSLGSSSGTGRVDIFIDKSKMENQDETHEEMECSCTSSDDENENNNHNADMNIHIDKTSIQGITKSNGLEFAQNEKEKEYHQRSLIGALPSPWSTTNKLNDIQIENIHHNHRDNNNVNDENDSDDENDSIANESRRTENSINSTAVVSSITNFSNNSSVRSISTLGSSITSSLQPQQTIEHLEYLLSSHTSPLSNVRPFTSATKERQNNYQRFIPGQNNGNDINNNTMSPPFTRRRRPNTASPIITTARTTTTTTTAERNEQENRTMEILRNVYQCKTKKDAMKLCMDQLYNIRSSSKQLVNLLFEYLQKFHDVTALSSSSFQIPDQEQQQQQQHQQHQSTISTFQIQFQQHKGLVLPSSAIGWLVSNMNFTNNDNDNHNDKNERSNNNNNNNNNTTNQPKLSQEMKLKLSQLEILLSSHVTHLKVNGMKWPPTLKMTKKQKKKYIYKKASFDDDDINVHSCIRFLDYCRMLENRPIIDLRLFANLKYLDLDGIHPHSITNLHWTSKSLCQMKVRRSCIVDATRLFSFCNDDDNNSHDNNEAYHDILQVHKSRDEETIPSLISLKHLSLSYCAIGEMSGLDGKKINFSIDATRRDNKGKSSFRNKTCQLSHPPLSSMKELVSLDLSNNELTRQETALVGLAGLPYLSLLNLSNNRLFSMNKAHMMLGNIKILILTGNRLSNVGGIERLYSLEQLDIGHNEISSLADVSGLAKLPELMHLGLEGNPMPYRIQVLNLFKEARLDVNDKSITFRDLKSMLPTIDKLHVTNKELIVLKNLTFKQSVPTIDDEGLNAQDNRETDLLFQDEYDYVKDDPSYRLMEPFRDEYIGPDGCTLAVSMAKSQSHRRTTRASRRKKVTITDDNFTLQDLKKSPCIRNANKTYAKVKLKKRPLTLRLSQLEIIPNIYPTLESVIESMKPSVGFHVIDQSYLPNNQGKDEVRQQPCIETERDSDKSAADLSAANDSFQNSILRVHSILWQIDEALKEKVKPYGVLNYNHKEVQQQSKTFKDRSNSEFPPNSDGKNAGNINEEESSLHISTDGEHASKSVGISDPSTDIDVSSKSQSPSQSVDNVLDDNSTQDDSSIPTTDVCSKGNQSVASSSLAIEPFNFAAAERDAVYDGPDEYSNLYVAAYLELYFRLYVFPSVSADESIDFSVEYSKDAIQENNLPRIQLYQTDRDLMMWTIAQRKDKTCLTHLQDNGEEHLISLWSEKILPCGVASTGRIPPIESEVKGSRGVLMFNEGKPVFMSDSQNLLLCISNNAVYFIPDSKNDALLDKKVNNRRFPNAIPSGAQFSKAIWPHAYCRHPLKFLKKITFDGYGFQRLTLHFKLPSLRGEIYMRPGHSLSSTSSCYTYIIFTCNQRRTIDLMKSLQEAAKEASPNSVGAAPHSSNDTLNVENDNSAVLMAITKAVAPQPFNDDILHYNVLHQIWNVEDKEGVRRSFIVTNHQLFLFHETYTGDGSGCMLPGDNNQICSQDGSIIMRTVTSANLGDVTDIRVINEDSRKVSITFKPQSRLRRSVYWLLLCEYPESAERLVENVRKAMNLNF